MLSFSGHDPELVEHDMGFRFLAIFYYEGVAPAALGKSIWIYIITTVAIPNFYAFGRESVLPRGITNERAVGRSARCRLDACSENRDLQPPLQKRKFASR